MSFVNMGSGSKILAFDIAGLSPGIGGGKSNFELKLQVAENILVIARGGVGIARARQRSYS
jgi:hypothetical protein